MRTIFFLILTIFFTVSAYAQQVETLTVEEAIIRARERAPERLALEALDRRANAMRQTASTFFTVRPELEVEYITERPFGESDYEFSVGLLQELPIWGSSARKDLASVFENTSRTSRDYFDRIVALRTRLLYNRAWSLDQQLQLGSRLIAITGRLTDATNKRLTAGDISRLDRNTVVLEANSIKIEHERVLSGYQQALAELEVLTGLSLQGVKLMADTTSDLSIAIDTTSLYRLSPEWVQLQNEIEIARAQVELAKAEATGNPTLGLRYSEDLLTIDKDQIVYSDPATQSIERITAPGRAAGITLSMQLPLTIPGLWGPDNLEVIEREAELRLLEANQIQLEIELTGKLRRLHPKLSRVGRALEIYRESVDIISENHELLDRGYEGGELSVTELLVGRRQLIELQKQQLELAQEMREAEIELQSILGK